MPIDLKVTLSDGSIHFYTIPLRMMLKSKENDLGIEYEVSQTWPWTHPTYDLNLPFKLKDIEKVEIDPTKRLADIDEKNNIYPIPIKEKESSEK